MRRSQAAAVCSVTFGLLGFLPAALPAAGPETKKAKAVAELLVDRESAAPGESVQLAIRFSIEPEWHLYWRNAGVAGMPPSVKWRLPNGVTAGPLQFPAPKRLPSPAGDSFVLEGRPVLLAEIRVPENAPVGQTLDIGAKLEWLVCKESCVLETQDVATSIPVRARDAAAAPANEGVFRAARAALPVASEKATHLKLTPVASVDRVRAGDTFQVALVLNIQDGRHIQSNKPLSPDFIATDVFPDEVRGLTVGEARFPPHKLRTVLGVGEVAEFGGRVIIVLPVKANADLAGDAVDVSGVLTYQACDDKTGQCFRPESVEWRLTVPVAESGAVVRPTHEELFADAEAGQAAAVRAKVTQTQYPLWLWLLLAVVAGLLLNVTPCVLPVISIKVLSFVQQAQESPARVFRLGLTFAAGMLVVFNVLAALATSAGLVWGQHFQSPGFVIAMAAIVFALGLSLFGVFTLSVPRAVEDFAGQQEREGYVGSFAKGALATALGTPCLGPVLGGVLTWAVTQPAAVVFLVFNLIGLGMAAPYVVLTANPRWLRFVPKPGAWMETFKHLMGFVLMATVVYLLTIILGQKDGAGVVWTAAFLVGVAFACWLWGRYVSPDQTVLRRNLVRAAALGVVALSWAVTMRSGGTERLEWQPFSTQRLAELTAAGHTVAVDVTAEWCLNCKYNLNFVFNTEAVAQKFAELGVVPLKADWTARDEYIGQFIETLAPGASIPLFAVFPAGRPNEPIVLLGLLTEGQVLAALDEAGPSKLAAPPPSDSTAPALPSKP